MQAEEGRTVFSLQAHAWCANEFGRLFGGMLALLAASAGSAAVQTTASAGTQFTALDMKLNIIRPVRINSGELIATGTVIHRGRQLALSNSEIVDARGKRVAVATGTTMLAATTQEQEPGGIHYQSA
jgi:uncharacterized protein (TIGR00369 family)